MIARFGTYGRVVAWFGGAGLIYGALAFVPSPLSLLDVFQTIPKLEIRKHPPLRLRPMPRVADFDVIAERPLFNPDRVPDPAVVAGGAGKPAGGSALGDPSQFRLVGIAGDSVTRLALVQKAGGGLMTLKPGDTLDGWTVTEISPKGVSITGGGRKEILTIARAANNAKTP